MPIGQDRIGEFSRVPFKLFNIMELKHDSTKYDVVFLDLLKETLLDREISFVCTWCYSSDFKREYQNNHNVLGLCTNIRHENLAYYDSDILVKIDHEDEWHTLFVDYAHIRSTINFEVKVYDYEEGTLTQELNIRKNTEQYNL